MLLRRLALALLVAAALAGCAKRGDPRAPEGQPDTFPQTYPSE
ncbi:MAG TPA: hypothetical protein VFA50_06010 [Stellaceae bacterium]|nr:hypothetical protein [Stellaceae bacterium]